MTESSITERAAPEQADTRRRIWAIVGASSGNLVEWFDFYVYSFCSLYFAHIFFPSGNTTTQLLQTAGVFAAGFLMRPIGGWLFGRIADRRGRKTSMLISVCMMCFGSLVIACLPGYAVIGTWAPALLLLARLFQGLSVGGEYGTSATYMSEVAIEGKKGFYASFQYVTLIGGQLLAVLVVVALQQVLSDEDLHAWGWRIPFALGAVLAIVALWLRRQLDETSKQETRALKEAGSFKGLWRNRRAFVMVLGFTAAGSLTFYTFTTYMQKYLVNTAGMTASTASVIMTAALFVYMLVQPLFGAFSDKVGRRTSMLCFGVLATLFTVPILSALQKVSSPYAAFGLVICALLIVSFYTSISGILKAEMFPAQVRALGVGLSYAVAHALLQQAIDDGATTLDTHEVSPVLRAYGIHTLPTWIAADSAEAVHIAEQIGYPVALKLRSPDIPHKSEVQGVMLYLRTAAEVQQAADAMIDRVRLAWPRARIHGLLVQSMANRAGAQELRVVVEHDPLFGPLIMLGEGGVEWRAEDQAAVALPPLNMNLARYLVIQAIKNKKIRGRSALRPLDIAGLSQLLVQVSNLIVDCPEIQRLDIHPLLASGNEFTALDVTLGLAPFSGDSESRLAIRPYPHQLEEWVVAPSSIACWSRACASLVLAVNESGSTGVSRSCFWLRRYSTICIKAVMVPSGVR